MQSILSHIPNTWSDKRIIVSQWAHYVIITLFQRHFLTSNYRHFFIQNERIDYVNFQRHIYVSFGCCINVVLWLFGYCVNTVVHYWKLSFTKSFLCNHHWWFVKTSSQWPLLLLQWKGNTQLRVSLPNISLFP